jgi:Arc/MetJ family transcription regulator
MLEHIDDVYEIAPLHRLMLQSLIVQGTRGEESFSRWLDSVDLDVLDGQSLRLVPALWRKFGHTVTDDSIRGRLQGVYRYYVCRNGALFAESRRTLNLMLSAGIDAMLFKGGAIALKYHGNLVERPMWDLDVLVHRDSVDPAREILQRCGWKYAYVGDTGRVDLHSLDYVNAARSGFDLHWHALYESVAAGMDEGVWARAEFFDWDGLVVKVMSPEDLLLTTIVNGVRIPNPMQLQWIHDLACIIATEPTILWETLWREAKLRDLREPVFNALNLVRGLSQDIVSESVLEEFLRNDREFYGALLRSALEEERTHLLPDAEQFEVQTTHSSRENPAMRSDANETLRASSRSASSARHIRYFLNEDGAIYRLYLQWRHLARIAQLFDISDPQALEAVVADCPDAGAGYLDVPPGMLSPRSAPLLTSYSARIALVDGPSTLTLSPGESLEIGLEVENDSTSCWFVCGGSSAVFGVSYHVLSEDGNTVVMDAPRSYLATARTGYVAFIEPLQKMACRLKVIAPRIVGRFVVQLDVVHEHQVWFSARGVTFPRIALDVHINNESDRYTIDRSRVVYETIDNRAIILNTACGVCYAANEGATFIWNALDAGHDVAEIESVLSSAEHLPESHSMVRRFISQLLAEELVSLCTAHPNGTRDRPCLPEYRMSQPPELRRHGTLNELIAMHPLRDASPVSGWPYRDGKPT